MRIFPLALTLSAALMAALVACTESDEPTKETSTATSPPASISGPQPQPEPAQALSAVPVKPRDGVVELATAGTLFTENNIEVKVGEPVTFRVTNQDAAVHNLRIAGIDGQFDTEDDAVTEPDMIGERGVGELTFAPSLPGGYTFRCDFHPGSMGGRITASE